MVEKTCPVAAHHSSPSPKIKREIIRPRVAGLKTWPFLVLMKNFDIIPIVDATMTTTGEDEKGAMEPTIVPVMKAEDGKASFCFK